MSMRYIAINPPMGTGLQLELLLIAFGGTTANLAMGLLSVLSTHGLLFMRDLYKSPPLLRISQAQMDHSLPNQN